MAKIIAEFCQNHKGDPSILKEMIWQAVKAGADYAKVQSYLADELTFRDKFEKENLDNLYRPYQKEYQRLKTADLVDENLFWFVKECKEANIEPLITIFTRQRIPALRNLGLTAVKVASYDCASFSLLEELKNDFKTFYISTGATFDNEVEKTAEIMKGLDFTFLHCITIYPTPLEELNLSRMDYLRRFTPKVGFSDHTLVERDGLKAAIAALSLGADVVERHFTVLPPEETKDGPVSLNPQQLSELVKFARLPKEEIKEYVKKNIPEYQKMLGVPNRPLTKKELLNRDYYRGRFASKVEGQVIYNWEDKKVF